MIVLGDVFPIRPKSKDSALKFGEEVSIIGLQLGYGMKYAIAKINEDDKILPNVALRAKIFDTSSRVTRANSSR